MKTYEGMVEDLTREGAGVVRGEKVVFVPGALPGDEILYRITKEKKNYCLGRLEKILQSSPNRRYGPGENPLGESYLLYSLEYEKGLALKQKSLIHTLEKMGNWKGNIIVHGKEDYTLNKIRLHYDEKSDSFCLYKRKSHEKDQVDFSLLFTEEGNKRIEALPEQVQGATYATLRRDTQGKFYLATDGKVLKKDGYAGVLDQNGMWGENPLMILRNTEYEVEIDGFFQNSTPMAEKALDLLGQKEGKSLLDLYSGVGFLSLYGGKHFQEILGVEVNAKAVELAKKNAQRNQIKADFLAMDTAKFIEENKRTFTHLIVDPPRTGIHPKLLSGILAMEPKEIFYMSCDPATFSRDLKELQSKYRVDTIHMLDMFPGTMHVECVALLSKLDSKKYSSVELPGNVDLTSA